MVDSPQTYKEERPWGSFETFVENTPATVKLLFVKADESLSLQYHRERDELWRILSGSGEVTIGDLIIPTQAGNTHLVPRGTNHRITGGLEGMTVLEVSTGTFREDDIVRIEDRYGRADTSSEHAL